jgi:flagellar motor switch protein FliG
MTRMADQFPRIARDRPYSDGARKAAIFLLALDEPEATAILRRLPAAAVDEISHEMSGIGDVPSQVRWRILHETLGALDAGGPEGLRDEVLPNTPFSAFRHIEARRLLALLEEEHPQTIALVLAHLPSACASEVLVCLPGARQVDVIRRIAALQATSPEVIAEIEQALMDRLNELQERGDDAVD